MAGLEDADQTWVDNQVLSGSSILFLGAGASLGAKGDDGASPPSGDQLRDLLSDRFLNGKLKDRPLAKVAEIAKGEVGLGQVQDCIAETFSPLRPAPFHLMIPRFRWHAIVSTNYDLVVEQSYQNATNPLQELSVVIKDGDLNAAMSNINSVPLIKIHGCITNTKDSSLPLILANEEIAKHRKNRERLFGVLQDWAKSHPIIFCGYDIADPNIAQILWDIGDSANSRPRYVTVNPGLADVEMSYWRDRRIIPIPRTFQEFLKIQDTRIEVSKRSLAAHLSSDFPLKRWIPSHEEPSESLASYLSNEMTHLHENMELEGVTPKQFYAGFSRSWSPFSQDLDVERRVLEDIIIEAVLEEASNDPRLFILKGHAGSGKSVTLRRAAWDAATKYDKLVFFIDENCIIDIELVIEAYQLVQQPFILFIEDAMPAVNVVVLLLKKLKGIPVTVIAGARTNEWNVWAGGLEATVTGSYELYNLSEKEIADVLSKLEKHGCLGELENMPKESRFAFFKLSADRQLLVALHEATSGKPFTNIIADELERITPVEAKQLYLDICTLHRFGVGVRAGLISRASGITFEEFENRFLKPLEHVVRVRKDRRSGDLIYITRHKIIAEIAFQEAFLNSQSRSSQIIRLISHMNIEYDSDRSAFGELIKGKTLADAFAEKQLCLNIFDAAERSGAPMSYVLHQKSIFELNHPDNNIRQAFEVIKRAEAQVVEERGVDSLAILHTKAIILQRMAKKAISQPEREKYRQDAKSILRAQVKNTKTSHAHGTLVSIIIDELEDKLKDLTQGEEDSGDLTSRALSNIVEDAEAVLQDAVERFPADESIKAEEARLAQNLQNTPRARIALETALKKHKGNAFVAIRLSRFYSELGEKPKSVEILEECLRLNPLEKKLHFEYARTLMRSGSPGKMMEITAHLRKSFSDGDSNYEAHFWYARQCFLTGDAKSATKTFDLLKKASMAPAQRRYKRGYVKDEKGNRIIVEGTVDNVNADFCFISTIAYAQNIFAHHSSFDDGQFDKIKRGARVRFFLTFTFSGPCADKVELVV